MTLETDVSVARWLDERLLPWRGGDEGVLVGEIVPIGFERYARILHPALERVGEGYRPIRWAELASQRGRRIHPEDQLKALLGEEFRDGPPRGELPREGSLPDELRRPLVGILRGFTGSPDRCHPGLEVVPSDLGQRFDRLGDTINPDEIPDLQE